MLIKLNFESPRAVYLQVIEQVKYAIATGALVPGDQLPTIRELARQTRVNRNTIARAYAELERDGIIYTRPGYGSFVSDSRSQLQMREKVQIITRLLDELLTQAYHLKLPAEKIEQLLKERLKKYELS